MGSTPAAACGASDLTSLVLFCGLASKSAAAGGFPRTPFFADHCQHPFSVAFSHPPLPLLHPSLATCASSPSHQRGPGDTSPGSAARVAARQSVRHPASRGGPCPPGTPGGHEIWQTMVFGYHRAPGFSPAHRSPAHNRAKLAHAPVQALISSLRASHLTRKTLSSEVAAPPLRSRIALQERLAALQHLPPHHG